jgi:Flp pilus assembly protein TadG
MIIKKLMRDRRGAASVTFLVLLVAVMAVGSLLADVAQLYATRIAARHMLNLSLRAAAAELDPEELKDNRVVIDEAAAMNRFYEVLRANMKLDTNNNPLPGSVADGPVEVCYFQVINGDKLPFSYTFDNYSETISRPAVTGIIRFPVKMSFWGRVVSEEADTDMYVHSTVTPELISKHL